MHSNYPSIFFLEIETNNTLFEILAIVFIVLLVYNIFCLHYEHILFYSERSAYMKSIQAFGTPDTKLSRGSYIMECTFEYFVALLVCDSFLSLLLTSMGLSEALIGVISSIISLAFLFEFAAVFVIQRVVNTKRFAIIFHTASELFFLSLYLIPLIPVLKPYRAFVVILCTLAAYFGNYFVTSLIYEWGNSYVDPHRRAEFSATKEMVSLICGIVVTVVAGFIMNRYVDADNTAGWFIFAACSIGVFSLCDLICLLLIRNRLRTPIPPKDRIPLGQVLRKTLGNKGFRSTVILACLWQISRYMTLGFLGTYKNMLFAVATIQIINAAGNICRFILSRSLGRYSDKHSFAKGIRLGLTIVACAFLCVVFTTPETKYLIIGFTVLYSIGIGAIEQNILNTTYNYVDPSLFIQASAVRNSLAGICGFLASLIASRIFTAATEANLTAFERPIYGQQVLALISVVLLIITIMYTKFVVEKQHREIR